MCIVHFYYPEMICYNYLLKSCEKNLNTLLANDNIPKPNQFGVGLFREENTGQQAGQCSGKHVKSRSKYKAFWFFQKAQDLRETNYPLLELYGKKKEILLNCASNYNVGFLDVP